MVAIAAAGNHNVALVGSGPPQLSAFATKPTRSGDQFSLSVPTENGRVYTLEISTNFSAWTPWSTNEATDGTLSVLDAGAPPLPFRYYRAVP